MKKAAISSLLLILSFNLLATEVRTTENVSMEYSKRFSKYRSERISGCEIRKDISKLNGDEEAKVRIELQGIGSGFWHSLEVPVSYLPLQDGDVALMKAVGMSGKILKYKNGELSIVPDITDDLAKFYFGDTFKIKINENLDIDSISEIEGSRATVEETILGKNKLKNHITTKCSF